MSPEYGFASFAGTAWKTKVKVALVDWKVYTGAHHLTLFAPFQFDPTDPDYDGSTPRDMVRILPVDTRIHIERLMFDNGVGSQLWVTASLDGGANSCT